MTKYIPMFTTDFLGEGYGLCWIRGDDIEVLPADLDRHARTLADGLALAGYDSAIVMVHPDGNVAWISGGVSVDELASMSAEFERGDFRDFKDMDECRAACHAEVPQTTNNNEPTRVYRYSYEVEYLEEMQTARILVPPGLDHESYLQGRQDEMAEGGVDAFDFRPDPSVAAFDIHRTLAGGGRDVWREFFPSKEAARASWDERVGDYVKSVEIVEVAQ